LCLDVVELINISRVTEVNLTSIMNVAFIFLECEVSNNLYSIQGMDNAYVTRFLYSPSRMALVLLDSTSFTVSLIKIRCMPQHGVNATQGLFSTVLIN